MRHHLLTTTLLLAIAAGLAPATRAQPATYAGRPLADVLRELQTAELRVIFSSELVPPTLRVLAEPKGGDRRAIALDLLAQHGLTLEKGPRGTELVVAMPRAKPRAPRERKAPAEIDRGEPAPVASQPGAPIRIEERVEVADRLRSERGGSIGYSVGRDAIQETAGGFENLFQVLEILPAAAAINDEEGKLAVRGAGPEHNLVVLDGVQIHNPYRYGELISSFLNPATASRVTLDASGFDAGHGGRLSSVTVIETRDGTRDRKLAMSGTFGVANGDVLFEGRLPKTESGSWWATARGTYYRPIVGLYRDNIMPSFGDVQVKVTTRPSHRTRLSIFGLVGREAAENLDLNDDGSRAIAAEFRGSNRLGVASLTWTPSARLVTATTLSYAWNESRDYDTLLFGIGGLQPYERDVTVRDLALRQRMLYATGSASVLEAGVELHALRSSWQMAGVKPPVFGRGLGPSTWGEGITYPPGGFIESRLARTQASFWTQTRLPLGRSLAVEPGARVDWNSYTGESSWQPRLRLTARVGGTALWGGFASQAQTPSHESLQGFDYFHLPEGDGHRLRNERSWQLAIGLERPLGGGFELRAEAYRRRFDRLLVQRIETDAERELRLSSFDIPPDLPPDSALLEYRPTVDAESTGRGTATGIELFVRRTGRRVSGWLGYSFSKTMRGAHGYEYPFDFDRPHALTAAVSAQLTRRLRVGATWRQASGFAVTPLVEEGLFLRTYRPDRTFDPVARPARRQDGSFMTGPDPGHRRQSLRNSVRLDPYSRVDVRATWATLGHWEVYGEVLNLFNTRNYLQTMPVPSFAGTEQGTSKNNIFENFERLPTFGVRVKF